MKLLDSVCPLDYIELLSRHGRKRKGSKEPRGELTKKGIDKEKEARVQFIFRDASWDTAGGEPRIVGMMQREKGGTLGRRRNTLIEG